MAERSSLVRLQREHEVELVWVGYELHPETPPGGVAVAEHFRDAEGMHAYVKSFAAGFGILDLSPPARLANTRRVLAVAEHARHEGKLGAFNAAAYDAYWRHGEGIESDAELAALARRAGLDPEAAVTAARDPALLARVDAARDEAMRAGVTGVPTFEVEPEAPGGSRMASRVVGCQRYEVLVDAVRRAGARKRESPPPAGAA
ncbi:MAG TPA: DsbA family protein [Anaeromyxobacter sp.]